ncbi:DUF423 domain-containing protein [Oleiagrimonas citrea]|uniref:DUF423 domain-containing protein n=1 Tax=Oleiagrimonas citrea TaxID=1665687 RepID=A0A846ZKF7_9GAMM|nr:DUF423 domain-containing protein [Oleiagrimonas citrea]NKZ37881.1 DUF423 domain-containing protein [Oleiagrimonas citrea]
MRHSVPSPGGWLVAIAGASAVLLGAFGAHGLRATLDAQHMQIWETAVQYQFWHALALALTVVLAPSGRSVKVALVAFALGIVLFSGSLYALALGAPRWTGIVTPFGGIAFVVGWLALGWSMRVRH